MGLCILYHRTILPTHFVTRRVRCLQSQSLILRNSRPYLFHSSSSKNFTNIKNSETAHKAEAVIQEGSNASEKKLATSFKELVQKKFTGISKKLNPDTPPSGKNIWNLIRDNWKQVLGAGILTDFLLAFVLNKFSEYRVNSALENGTQPRSNVLEDEFIPRPRISEALMKIFQPSERQSYYHVVCGEHGTGKTTLIMTDAKHVGKGVIYVDIPSDFENLGKAFGKAINLSFFEDISIIALLMRKLFSGMGVNSESAISLYQWRRVMEIFRRASEVYKKKNKKPPVIIYDNISRTVKENSKILDILQDDAKDNADKRSYIAVFVSSEGSVRRMESRSAWSRADKPVIEIGDLSKEESMKYLIEKHEIKEEEAKRLYELVGGRILDLKAVADKFLAGRSFEVIKQQVFDTVYDNIEAAEMNPGQPNHEAAKIIIKDLIDSNKILHVSKLREMTKVEPSKLLESNVFAYHPENKTVTFQSRSTECYIHENEKLNPN